MTTEQIMERLQLKPELADVDGIVIRVAVEDAQLAIAAYPFREDVLGYATYLYASHLLFVRLRDMDGKSKFKSVKAENATFTKFDDANEDTAWKEFERLAREQGLFKTVVKFY